MDPRPDLDRVSALANPPPRLPHRLRGQQVALSAGAGALAAVLVVALATHLAGSPSDRRECAVEGAIGNVSAIYLPAVLVNSPYGGGAWGNGTFPATFPGIWNGPVPPGVKYVSYGTGALNGSAIGEFFTVGVVLDATRNITVPGSGPSSPCSGPYSITLVSSPYYIEAGGGILPQNSTADSWEPSTASLPTTFGVASDVSFNNSFIQTNQKPISTCGTTAVSIPVIQSSYLDVSIPVPTSGGNMSIAYTIPVQESYHYFFPANFGTWQVDNLTAPGGPGGGWAFSYSPCP